MRQRTAVVAVKFSLNQTIEHFDVLATFDLIKKDKSRMNIADIKIDGCKYLGSMYQNNIVGKLFKGSSRSAIYQTAVLFRRLVTYASLIFHCSFVIDLEIFFVIC